MPLFRLSFSFDNAVVFCFTVGGVARIVLEVSIESSGNCELLPSSTGAGWLVILYWCHSVMDMLLWCRSVMVLSHGAMLPCKCISLNNTSSDQSGSPTTTAGITQCHAAAHTCSLSSPTLSSNRDKQHEICCDSALHGPGLLQDRTQGWLAPSLVDELPHVSNEEDNIQKIHKIPVNRCNIKNR